MRRGDLRNGAHVSLRWLIAALALGTAVALAPEVASAGRLQNPLVLFTQAGDEVRMRFRDGFLLFEGLEHEFVGKSTYQAQSTLTSCDASTVGQTLSTVRIFPDHAQVIRSDYLGCGAGRPKKARQVIREFQRQPVAKVSCQRHSIALRNGERTVSVNYGCDGTMRFEWWPEKGGEGPPDGASRRFSEWLSKRGSRFSSRGQEGGVRWNLTVTPPRHSQRSSRWKISGMVSVRGRVHRFTGRYLPAPRPRAE